MVDRLEDRHMPLLPAGTGSTETALIRPAPEGDTGPLYVYLASDVGLPRKQLIGLPFGPNGHRGEPRTLALRDDAELEAVDADDAGRLLLLVWNVAGSSELELFDTTTHERTPVSGLPGTRRHDPGAVPRRAERGARRRGTRRGPGSCGTSTSAPPAGAG